MQFFIRPLKTKEAPLLADFLYEAIFVPETVTPPAKDIIYLPQLQIYISHFGHLKDDYALAAEKEGRVVGVVWVRIINDFAHVDDTTPSLAVSVLPPYRGKGIGRALLTDMLELLKQKKYKQVSLSVQKQNPAVRLYKRLGFLPFRDNQEECVLVRPLD